MGAVSLDERHRARIERMMMEEEESKELEVEVTNIGHFLSDPSPIIGYACHSLPNSLPNSLTDSLTN